MLYVMCNHWLNNLVLNKTIKYLTRNMFFMKVETLQILKSVVQSFWLRQTPLVTNLHLLQEILAKTSKNTDCPKRLIIACLFVGVLTSLLNIWSLLVSVVLWPMCCHTGMSCCRHMTWHPTCHSIQTRGRPVVVLSFDVECHTGIHDYPFYCLCSDQIEKSFPVLPHTPANAQLYVWDNDRGTRHSWNQNRRGRRLRRFRFTDDELLNSNQLKDQYIL